jgi:hypothetical protein
LFQEKESWATAGKSQEIASIESRASGVVPLGRQLDGVLDDDNWKATRLFGQQGGTGQGF